MDGIIVVNKPSDITSHDVVHKIRKIFPGVKAGHSGTLDPMATGVLPVCLGRATRVVEYIIELPKTYRASLILGITTDTQDSTGNILKESPVPYIDQSGVEIILNKFIGVINQLPPLYSAVKYQGKPMYHWVRRGETVPRKIRSAEIYSINLLKFEPDRKPHLVFDVQCSRGTYIRTLAADIGNLFGCGAHLSSLIRSAVGPYQLVDAVTIEEIGEQAAKGCSELILKKMDTALSRYPKLNLTDKQITALKNGQIVIVDQSVIAGIIIPDSPIRVYDSEDMFRAIVRLEITAEGTCVLKTLKYLSS